MSIVTFTTDFGLTDGYVGTMKGVILSIAPSAMIVDISHEIEPQNLRQAAYVLSTAAPYFPAGTVHIVVVDPGVGSARRPIAVRTAEAYFVGPDNGVLSHALGRPGASTVHLDQPRYWLPDISRTFHGRDIFSPVGAHLSSGVPFEALGTPIADALTFPVPQPEVRADGSIRGQVLHADRFGNLITNIPMEMLAVAPGWRFTIGHEQIGGLSATYGAADRGALVAIGGSEGLLEIAVREGSASAVLGVRAGALVWATPAGAPVKGQ